jgi:hypothetical protein
MFEVKISLDVFEVQKKLTFYDNTCFFLLFDLEWKYCYFYFRSCSSILTYVRRHKLIKFTAGFLLVVLLFRLTKPNYFSYGISYAKIIYDLVNTDMQRQNDVMKQDAWVFALEINLY